jgi:hypothetical protein
MSRRLALVPILALFVFVSAGATADPAATAGAASTAGPATGAGATSPATQAASPEEQLAQMYAPIAMLKRQEEACDRDGESYVPAPIEAVLGDPAVALKQNLGGDAEDDPIVMMGPTAADLFGKDDTYYIDLPGNPRSPGCDYEQYSRARMEGRVPTTYAHIVVDPDGRGLMLEYWFYFVYNYFNNTHESDWEGLQIRFDAASAAEALTEEPVQITVYQHGGGEIAAWTDDKVQREGTRPVVFVAAGSHATHYGNNVYLGWGDNGTGFGCDITTEPSDRVPLEALLVPSEVTDPNSPFAWIAFKGRWGERQPWEYNGPFGPNTGKKWTDPFTWEEGKRDSSIEVAGAETLGPGPTDFFCTASAFFSRVLTSYKVYPAVSITILLLVILVPLGLLIFGWGILWEAAKVYWRHVRVFIPLGLVLIPLGLLANGFQYLLINYPPGEQIYELLNESPAARLAAAITVGSLQHLIGLILVGPAVIEAVSAILAGRSPGFVDAYSAVLQDLRKLVRAVLRPAIIIAALALSVVGIPWAINRYVRWNFVAQAAVLDDAQDARTASELSSRVVDGHWWRAAAIIALFLMIGALPGPLIGVILLIFYEKSVEFVNAISSLIFAVTLPYSVIGLTVLYRRLQGGEQPAAEEQPAPVPAPAPA